MLNQKLNLLNFKNTEFWTKLFSVKPIDNYCKFYYIRYDLT